VCRHSKDYVDRIREINGFALDNIPSLRALPAPDLDRVIPLIFNRGKRERNLTGPLVALPLSLVVDHRMVALRFRSLDEIRAAFGLSSSTNVVLSGTASDPPLERWWRLGDARRKIIRQLSNIGVSFATAPNFSLFSDQPRWDDLHSIKRIGIVHEEFLAEGLPCALHVNARTDTDMKRWIEYTRSRPEIQHVSYEFLTGAGWLSRRNVHATWLRALATSVSRPLTLVLRGGVELVPRLSTYFDKVVVIDSTAFMKAMKRQRAILTNRAPTWMPTPTPVGAPLDDLVEHNIAVMNQWLSCQMNEKHPQPRRDLA
jgi:hypothetical protein